MYVVEIRANTREVVLGPKESLAKSIFTIKELDWVDSAIPVDGKSVTAQVRYAHSGNEAILKDLGEGRVEVTMLTPAYQISPGQAAVFYDGDRMLGGGWIEVPESAKVKIQIEM